MFGLLAPYANILVVVSFFTLVISSFWIIVYEIKRKEINKQLTGDYFPSLSVIIPAHNEESDINDTLRSLFKTSYPKNKIEVIVVDDCSTDRTLSIIKKYPVQIIQNAKKMGKVFSLNKAISKAKGDVVITMDADSIIQPNTLSLMARHFQDKRVGAVAGVYKTKSEKKMIEKMQSLEYLWFALSRKLQETLDCVLVIPGALGAFRKDVLKKVGGFDTDTMIEDYDITLKIHKTGYKIRCEKNAVALISAPPNLSSLLRQRTRWFRGGFQIYKKHFDLFLGKIGMISFIWFTEVVAVAIQMIVLCLLMYEIVKNLVSYPFSYVLSSSAVWFQNVIMLNFTLADSILIISSILFILGVVNSALSIKLMNESASKILLYPLMMIYCALLMFVFFKSFADELFGIKRVWSLEHGKC